MMHEKAKAYFEEYLHYTKILHPNLPVKNINDFLKAMVEEALDCPDQNAIDFGDILIKVFDSCGEELTDEQKGHITSLSLQLLSNPNLGLYKMYIRDKNAVRYPFSVVNDMEKCKELYIFLEKIDNDTP